jgi:hypothetical protein
MLKSKKRIAGLGWVSTKLDTWCERNLHRVDQPERDRIENAAIALATSLTEIERRMFDMGPHYEGEQPKTKPCAGCQRSGIRYGIRKVQMKVSGTASTYNPDDIRLLCNLCRVLPEYKGRFRLRG